MSAPLDEATLAPEPATWQERQRARWRRDAEQFISSMPEGEFARNACHVMDMHRVIALLDTLATAETLVAELEQERAVYAGECDRLRGELLAWTLLAGEWEAVARQFCTVIQHCAKAVARVPLPATTNGRAVLLVGDAVRGLSGSLDGDTRCSLNDVSES